MEQAQRLNIQPVMSAVYTAFEGYSATPVNVPLWHRILEMLFPLIEAASRRASEIAREFYDAERARQGLPPHAIPLKVVTYDQLHRDLYNIRRLIHKPVTTEEELTKIALRVARTIENSGRWTLMTAHEYADPGLELQFEIEEHYAEEETTGADPLDKPRRKRYSKGSDLVRGWARVATGRETCGWCLMLVSRGPVYRSAKSAGSSLDENDALQLSGAGEFDVAEHMTQWHTGCDCKVVPVFRLDNWEGRDRYLAAEKLWRTVTKGLHGKDAQNAFRRAVEAGEYQEALEQQPLAA